MKRRIALSIVVIFLFGILGCSSVRQFQIAGAGRIKLRSGLDGTMVEITDEETIGYITDNVNALKFQKGKSSSGYGGWSYRISWYDSNDKLMEQIVVMSEYVIDYQDHFWSGMSVDQELDLPYLDALLENGQ